MSKALKGIILFTAIEVVGLVWWLLAAGVPFNRHFGAVVVLIVFLFGEHYVSVNVGHGRSPFGPLPPD